MYMYMTKTKFLKFEVEKLSKKETDTFNYM